MSYGFVKLYGSKLITSSLWDECPEARLVFLGMLAIADYEGYVDCPNERALARVLNLDVEYVERALAVLTEPDPGSRTRTEDGRRVIRKGPGWLCVNYEIYREFRSPKQEADRKRMAAKRAEKRGSPVKRRRAQTEAEHRDESIRLGRMAATEFE